MQNITDKFLKLGQQTKKMSVKTEVKDNDSSPSSSSASTSSGYSSGPNSSESQRLPPCKVCGAQGTGFHYGANTCEACKGFFQRSLKKNDFVCLKSEKCHIQPAKRNLCPFCRYQKCMEAGMSHDAIKTGRYTHAKKTRDILEIKRQRQESLCIKESIILQSKSKDYDEILEKTRQLHSKHYPNFREHMMVAQEHQKKFLEYKKAREELFGSMEPMCHDDFFSLYEKTGVKIDDRIEEINNWLIMIEPEIKLGIAYSKDIPGFQDLDIEDQLTTIKSSFCEMWIIAIHLFINLEAGCYITQTGVSVEMNKVSDKPFLECFNLAISTLQKLMLTHDEAVLLKTLILFPSDRESYKNPMALDKLFFRYFDVLQYLVSLRKDSSKTMCGIYAALANLRNVSAQYSKDRELFKSYQEHLTIPPLVKEVLM